MLHRHEASVEEERVEGGRVDDGNKRGRNGARHGRREGGSERGRDCARKGWSKGARKLNFKGCILSIQYIHTPSVVRPYYSHPATRSCHCYFVISNEK